MHANTALALTLVASAILLGCSTENTATPSAASAAHPDFTGVWSGAFTTQKHDYWELEDLTACFPGCTPTARAHYASLIENPANDSKPVQALWGEVTAFMRAELAAKSTPEGLAIQEANNAANDPNFQCKPYGLVRAAVNPLPIRIRSEGAHLAIDYEEWNQSRTIFMDGRAHPAGLAPTRLGHSVGHYEGQTLVVETTGLEPSLYYDFQSGGGHSAQASVVERYVIADEPRRLELTMTITDPVTLREPHVIEKTWLYTPDVELLVDSCEDVPGKFPEEGV